MTAPIQRYKINQSRTLITFETGPYADQYVEVNHKRGQEPSLRLPERLGTVPVELQRILIAAAEEFVAELP